MLSVVNNGSGRTLDVEAELVTGSPFIEILESQSGLAFIEPLDAVNFDPFFSVRMDDECPQPYRAVLYIRLSNENGPLNSYLIDLTVGGGYCGFDRDEEPWEHENLNEDHIDQWHISDEDNYSYGGSRCLKAGSEQQGGEYEPMLNCAAYMPPFYVSGPLQLIFWHKIDAEISVNHEGECYDGGYVEISVEDGEWELIYPDTPQEEPHYPYVFRHGQSPSPTIEQNPCYSGQHDWELAMFDLSEFEDSEVQVRFCFASDGADNCEGWWLDDIEVILPRELEPPDNLEGEIIKQSAHLTWSAPEIQRDDIFINELLGYSVFRYCIETGEWVTHNELVLDNCYIDDLSAQPSGEYWYMVSAEYIAGESDPTDFLFLDWYNTIDSDVETIPEQWEITSTCPNPFNSTARIGYSVPVQGHVQLAVFDLRGRLVTELVNSTRQPGRYETLFDGDELSSGVYLVRMQTPVGNMASKLVLIR